MMVLFGFFALVLVSIYWVNLGVKLFDQLIGDGQSTLVFLEFAALTLPNVIRLVLPIAAFAATIYVVNRMTSESELVVMHALGCSPWRLARPVFMFGCVVAILMAVLTHFLVPASRAQLKLREAEVDQDITARLLVEGQFLHPMRGITVFIRDIEPGGALHDLFLSDMRSDKNTFVTYTAKRALLESDENGPVLVMFDGLAQSLDNQDNRLSITYFDDFVFNLGALVRARQTGAPRLESLPTPVLLNPDERIMRLLGQPRSSFLYEGHARSAQPLLAVAGALIGYGAMLIGGFSRFGLGRQMGLAIGLLIAVQLLDNTAADLARRDAALWPVTYLAPAVGVVLGLALIAVATRRRRLPRARAEEAPA